MSYAHKSADKKIRTSLRYSLYDGLFASVMQGLSESFIAPYALAMRAGVGLVGILASLPNLAGSFLQILSAPLVERFGSRKRVITSAVLIHALLWVPIIALPYISVSHVAVWLLILYTFLIAIGTLSFPPWASLMADHVPERERGNVFGWRNRAFGIVNVSSMFIGGVILYLFRREFSSDRETMAFAGFTVIFSIACVARIASWFFLAKMYEPKLLIRAEHRFTLLDFLKRVRKTNFGRFAIFVAAMNFSVFITSPYFAVYMLRDLRFDYLTFTVVTMSATLTILFMMRMWGRYADSVGNVRVLKLCARALPFVPLLWLVSRHPIYLIAIQIFAGFFWSGFNLSVTNFIYDAVIPEKRTRCIAYFNVMNGVAVFSGALLGGFLSQVLPPVCGYRILAVVTLSGIMRLLMLPLVGRVREVRKVKEVSSVDLFYSIIGLRPDLRQAIFSHPGEE